MKAKIYLMSALLFLTATLSADHKVRAAFDLGSGSLKMQVSLVDSENQKLIGEPFAIKNVYTHLYEDFVTHEGMISPEKEAEILILLRQCKGEALKSTLRAGYTDVEFTGIATAVFRLAANGLDVLSRWEHSIGFPLRILSQEEEGKIGFLTAKALFPDVTEKEIFMWDTGKASSQMVDRVGGEYHIQQCPFGFGTVRLMLATEIRNGIPLQSHQSGLPISDKEAIILSHKIIHLLPESPEWLFEKLVSEELKVLTFGDEGTIESLILHALSILEGKSPSHERSIITLSDVERLYHWLCNKDDRFFEEHQLKKSSFISLVMMRTMMNHFGFSRVHFAPASGSTIGLLLAPEFWPSSLSLTH